MTLLLRNGKLPQFKLRPTNFEQGRSITVPAPYGGINLRDDITALKPNEARVLENWFPTNGQVELREGFSRHVGGMGSGEVKTLAAYMGLTSSKLLAAAGGNIYRIPFTSGTITAVTKANPAVVTITAHPFSNSDSIYIDGVVGMTELNETTFTVANVTANTFELSGINSSAYTTYVSGGTANLEAVSLASGLTQARWQTEMYNNRLFFVNGADAPKDYDGSVIASTSWTGSGLTITNLVNVALSRNRLWFCENSSADVWYGGIGSITGALTKFQLSQIAAGGTCMAIGSWSRDAGDGADDFTVFVMSTGEIIIYQGDPATTFSLVGKYAGAPPIGRRCLFKVGGELVVITDLGFLPVSAAVGGVALDLARIDPWGKIAPGVVDDAFLHRANGGWHGVLHEGIVFVNVPQTEGSLSKQWVLNTRNGSWTTFKRWNPSALCSFSGTLYFGAQTGGTVYEVGGSNDNENDILTLANCAFVTPSNTFQSNLFTGIRPKTQAEGSVSGVVGVDTDFVLRSNVGSTVPIVDDPSSTPWGSEWGSPWGRAGQAEPLWFSITGVGRSVSVRLRATAQSADLRWFATDLVYKPGGIK